ncbi:MAG: hypothetical protein J5627_03155, partial [Bacilli bacterium]|nr:hypothetical protein [Bacilli bacterium]
MKKKSLAFFALNVIALSACSYNPFNDFLGIGVDIVIPTSDRLNAFQNYNYLFWDKNEECEGYDVYLYEDVLPSSSSSSSSKANSSLKSSRSSKSSLSSSKANNDPVANTSSCNYPVQDAWVGKQIKVVGYKYEASSEGVYSEKKTVAESEKIIITDNVAPLTDPDYLFYDDDTLRYLFRNRDYGTITIPETATHVVIENVSRNYYPTFEFSPREDNSVVWIELINSTLVGKTSYSNPTRFRYLGTNKNVSFYFHVLGH